MLRRVLLAPLVVLALLLLPLFLLWRAGWGSVLRGWFWWAHRRHGRDVLFVYSQSPNWQSYVEANILPRLDGRAVVLDYSERRYWSQTHPWEERLFRHLAGARNFNPIALLFQGPWRVAAVRFYQPFHDYKHGREEPLRRAVTELDRLLDHADAP